MWVVFGILALLFIFDVTQKKHAIVRNYPLIGHLRYLLEAIGPELRQYIVTSNDEERPFSRDQRRWIYASSKHENDAFGFGTDNDLDLSPSYIIIRQAEFPLDSPPPGTPGHDPNHVVPCAKILGAHRRRSGAFRPASIVNVSA